MSGRMMKGIRKLAYGYAERMERPELGDTLYRELKRIKKRRKYLTRTSIKKAMTKVFSD